MPRPYSRQVVTDSIPRVCMRWDDGSFHQLEDARWALHYGLPHGFCVNWETLRDGGSLDRDELDVSVRFTKEQLRQHLTRAKRAGVAVDVIHHTRTNWAKYGPGNWDSYTWADILEELRKDDMEAYLGVPVDVFLEPGGDVVPWAWSNKEWIKDALDRLGFRYAFGLEMSTPSLGNGVDGHGFGLNEVTYGLYGTMAPDGNKYQVPSGHRPGSIRDPLGFVGGWTFDLGSTVIPRGVWSGSEVLPDPNSGAPGWLLGRDNGRGAVDGSPTADWNRTLQFKLNQWMATGLSFVLGLHGSKRTEEDSPVVLSDGSFLRPGHFSTRHLCWLLRALQDAGFLKVVTFPEWCEYVLGRYANGVELTNPRRDFACPLHVVGDLSGGHLVYPAQLTNEQIGQSTFPGSLFYTPPADADADQLYNDVAPLDSVIGPAVVGSRGFPGGCLLRANAYGNTVGSGVRFGWVKLPPGKYRFLVDLEDAGTAGKLRLTTGAVGQRYLNTPQAILESTDGEDKGRVQWAPLFYSQERVQMTLGEDAVELLQLEVTLPEDPTPYLGARATDVDPGTIAAVADLERVVTDVVTTADLASIADAGTLNVDLTVAGVVAGQRADVFTETDLQGLTYKVPLAPATDTVRVVLENNTGAPVDLATTTWTVRVSGPAMFETDVTVTGAKAGRSILAQYDEELGGLDLEARLVAPNTIRVAFVNRTGSGVTLARVGDLWVYVEEDPLPFRQYDAFAASAWVYQFQVDLAKDGLSECKLTNPRLFRWDL